jgi:hypothetical protein
MSMARKSGVATSSSQLVAAGFGGGAEDDAASMPIAPWGSDTPRPRQAPVVVALSSGIDQHPPFPWCRLSSEARWNQNTARIEAQIRRRAP